MEDERIIVRLNITPLKIGPGNSVRSHMANEYIFVKDIDNGINTYIHILNDMMYYLVNDPETNIYNKL